MSVIYLKNRNKQLSFCWWTKVVISPFLSPER